LSKHYETFDIINKENERIRYSYEYYSFKIIELNENSQLIIVSLIDKKIDSIHDEAIIYF
jgi:hypothetical protein